MEFYSESRHRSRKERACTMCGRKIHAGEYYYSERGKYDGDFFSRDMHTYCHNMECEYCSEVDTEFCWDSITEYIEEKYCGECEHAAWHDDRDGWTECEYRRITDCPKILKIFEDEDIWKEN